MWSEVVVYLKLGLTHITDLNGFDHVLFLVALCAVFTFRDWRRVVWLVTAFTVGHSLTLVLATLDLVRIEDRLVELLIPATILLTALANILVDTTGRSTVGSPRRLQTHAKYAIALIFGLIHGLGFSNFLRNLLGQGDGILLPLFSFNVGLEIGQVLIVFVLLVIGSLVVRMMGVKHREWTLVVSGVAFGAALIMVMQRMFP